MKAHEHDDTEGKVEKKEACAHCQVAGNASHLLSTSSTKCHRCAPPVGSPELLYDDEIEHKDYYHG